jgi:hypothetical protein
MQRGSESEFLAVVSRVLWTFSVFAGIPVSVKCVFH